MLMLLLASAIIAILFAAKPYERAVLLAATKQCERAVAVGSGRAIIAISMQSMFGFCSFF